MVNETFCGTKNDLATPSAGFPGTKAVGKEPETGSTTGVGTLNPGGTKPSLVTGGDIYPPGTPWSATPSGSLPSFYLKDTVRVSIADVDGDGDNDIIVATVGGKPTELYINPGDGVFTAVQPVQLGPSGASMLTPASSDVAVADVNGDGAPDIVLANKDGRNQIYLGNPSSPGAFVGAPLMFGAPTDVSKDVEIADVDGDGALDLVVANDGQPNKVYYGDPALAAGSAPTYGTDPALESSIGTGSAASTSVELADLNGDGHMDLVLGNSGARDEVYLGQSGSHPDLSVVVPTLLDGLTQTADLKVGDITGDGILDILVASNGGNNLLYPGQSSGDFSGTSAAIVGSETGKSLSVDLIDTDGDGDLDAVFGNSDSSTATYTNEGGTLSSTPQAVGIRSTESGGVQHAADFSGDGVPDLLTGTDIVLGDGSGDFSNGVRVPYNMGGDVNTPATVTSVDIDLDGCVSWSRSLDL